MADLSEGIMEFARRVQVWTHMHDRGTLWANNSANARATDLVWWFRHNLVDQDLAEALVLTPYTDPERWDPYLRDSPAMLTLLNHQDSVADRAREVGYPVLGGVEAQIIPVDPGNVDSTVFDIDVDLTVRWELDYVIASAHSQPEATEKSLPHVQASRHAALIAQAVHTLGHIDRYVQHLPWPDRDFFEMMTDHGVAFELNGNYLRRFGFLQDGVWWADSWDEVTGTDQPMSRDEFEAAGLEGHYMDYRYTHLVRLAVEAETHIIPALDWHLWHDPADMSVDKDLSQEAVARLDRFGRWMALRGVPPEQCPTHSLDAFEQFLSA